MGSCEESRVEIGEEFKEEEGGGFVEELLVVVVVEGGKVKKEK